MEDWPPHIVDDFIDLFCGKKLGSGASRDVHIFHYDETRVLKIELHDGPGFQNVIEWETWGHVQETKWAEWFAPCHWISECGKILIQDRTYPLRENPKQLPNFFSDLKRNNFGVLKGKIVAHDYGLNLLMSKGLGTARMKKTDLFQSREEEHYA